ncbi:hypothetical protein OS175_10330 [Marinicella sp. S1101]|uniref:hypothetical protein n=1 Tax=Marinicella marina TaxID=2996016 RepID=UPI002260A27B|nr:hypothetical protein [Marinicella marina]MCX7554276.1 hypothetical protein [Marinicella marina]MDJ1138733.1 hypothetical protein [Marinicella marina]
MNNDLKNKLQRDAKYIQQQAAARLQTIDLNAHIQAQLEARSSSKWFQLSAVAAALCLTFIIALMVARVEPSQFSHPNTLVKQSLFDLKLDDLPNNLEQQLNQPLIQEQQAIIDDLKRLKTQLLSI